MATLVVTLDVRAETASAPPPPGFAPGQVWSIKSASTTTTKVIIGRVESWNGKVAVHVSIIDIPIPQGAPGAGGITRIDHMPFDKSALAASVSQLLATGVSPAPNFENGYEQWRSDKRAGIYTVGVLQAVEMMFEALSRGRG